VGMTPEGRIKHKVKIMLATLGEGVYAHWPVQNGMGSPTLDCIGCAWGFYFAIETKAPFKKPTARQDLTIGRIKEAGGVTFVVSTDEGVEDVRVALEMLKYANHRQ
jgi:hypothetical protein